MWLTIWLHWNIKVKFRIKDTVCSKYDAKIKCKIIDEAAASFDNLML